jgi:transposase
MVVEAILAGETTMPKLLCARPPQDAIEERQVRRLALSRHAPADWVRRAQMIVRSWNGERTSAIAATVGCHPHTVRERFGRFNAEGIDGPGDHSGAGRKPRLTEGERSVIIGLVATTPPGWLVRDGTGTLAAADDAAPAHWTLNALTAAAQQRGIIVARSQVRRILLAEQVRWRQPRSWTTSADPEFAPKGPRSSRSIPAHRKG